MSRSVIDWFVAAQEIMLIYMLIRVMTDVQRKQSEGVKVKHKRRVSSAGEHTTRRNAASRKGDQRLHLA